MYNIYKCIMLDKDVKVYNITYTKKIDDIDNE